MEVTSANNTRGVRVPGRTSPLASAHPLRHATAGVSIGGQVPAADKPVTPLFAREVTRASLGKWLKRERIDCVLVAHNVPEIQAWVSELGYRVPDEMGLASICLFADAERIAGIDEQLHLLGEAAADFLISLLRNNERGQPNYPRYSLIEGRWVDRPTVRPGAVVSPA